MQPVNSAAREEKYALGVENPTKHPKIEKPRDRNHRGFLVASNRPITGRPKTTLLLAE